MHTLAEYNVGLSVIVTSTHMPQMYSVVLVDWYWYTVHTVTIYSNFSKKLQVDIMLFDLLKNKYGVRYYNFK